MPPEYPEKKTESISIGSGLPVVHSINGFSLEQKGWINVGKNTYKKRGKTISYDGVYWSYNGKRVQFFEDLKDKK